MSVRSTVYPLPILFSDEVVVVDEGARKEQSKKPPAREKRFALPSGFRWIDDNTIFCEKDESELVYVAAGIFIMGSESIHAFDVEKPEHEVYLDDYFIDMYPTTWGQFFKFCEETGYPKPKPPRWGIQKDHPVVNISWFDVQEYGKWTGKTLPSEAQWEKAARGGIWLDGDALASKDNSKPRRKYPWGDEAPNADNNWRANYNAEPRYGKNHGTKSSSPIGKFYQGMSPYGVMDIAGNVWEWCLDWFDEDYYSYSPRENPTGPAQPPATEEKPSRVLRGGSWYIGSRLLRVSARRSRPPDGKGASCGMRCVVIPN